MKVAQPHTAPPRIPAFRQGVPEPLRIALLIGFAIIFQSSNTVYTTLVGQLAGADQLLREDLNYLLQMTTIGICLVFPLLFRLKLRFTSQQLIIGASLTVLAMMWISLQTSSVSLNAAASAILGAAKMIGTFEALISIQLIITPKRDYGVFFSVALALVLITGQASGVLAVELSHLREWRFMYEWVALANAVMILLTLAMFRHVHVARRLPLYGIDWKGLGLWLATFSAIAYVFSYGQVLDWFYAEEIRMASGLSVLLLSLTIWRMAKARRPYVALSTFTLRNVSVGIVLIIALQLFMGTANLLPAFVYGTLGLDDMNNAALNWWIAAGIAAGGLFSYFWFRTVQGAFKVFFTIAFSALTIYSGCLCAIQSGYANADLIRIPYLLRGFGQMLIFAGTAKYVTNGVGAGSMMQVLCYLAMVRNAIGSLIPNALITSWAYRLNLHYLQRLAARMDNVDLRVSAYQQSVYARAVRGGQSSVAAQQLAGKALLAKVNQQTVMLANREIFGTVTVFGIILLLSILLLHFSRPFIAPIPGWRTIRAAARKGLRGTPRQI